MQLETSQETIRHLQELGGAVFVWPGKARCCGGAVTLDASTTRPKASAFRRLQTRGIELHLAAGMSDPDSHHLELSRKGPCAGFLERARLARLITDAG
jgi:hypothetical protein